MAALLLLVACADETISGYVDRAATYTLVELNGEPFTANATITFSEEGQAKGEAPCNAWSAAQTAPYPWIDLGPIAATKRACLDLAAEQAFFDALTQASLAEVSGNVLILSLEDGQEMVFRAD